MNRKEFVKTTGMAVASLAVLPSSKLFANGADPKVRVALIGVGLRGQNHHNLKLMREDVDVVAICDIDDRMLTRSKEMITKSGKKMPQVYTGDIYCWKKMLELKGIDTVIIATPWEWHKEMIIGSLEAGIKYVGTEVML